MIYSSYYNMQSNRFEKHSREIECLCIGFIVQTDPYQQRKPHILGIYRLLLVRNVDWTRDCRDEWCQVKRMLFKDVLFPIHAKDTMTKTFLCGI